MVSLGEACLPAGERIYAIGDVHGCLDALLALEAQVHDDVAASVPARWCVLPVGDYIDRGAESAGVLHWLTERSAQGTVTGILGNHDAMLLAFLHDPDTSQWPVWLDNGGEATLASFGIGPPDPFSMPGAVRRRAIRAVILDRLGPDGLACLEALPRMLRHGDYAFVHAGVRPGVPLDHQDPEDLIWIREPFLDSQAEFGAVVVHGHTPTDRVVLRPNRIGIDTGAVFGGSLSCLVLEGRRRWLLTPEGRRALD